MKRAAWVAGVTVLFCLSLLLTLPQTPARSQEITPDFEATPIPDEASASATPSPESVLEQAPEATAEPASDSPVEPTPAPTLPRPITSINAQMTLRELGEGNLRMKGLSSYAELWIPLPANWLTEYLEIQLQYSASPIINPQRASLTVRVNDQEVTTFRLAAGNPQPVTFQVPIEYVDQGNGFSLAFSGYLKTTDYLCEEADNPGQWVTILDTTAIRLGANPENSVPDLRNLARLLVPQALETPPSSLLFALPENPDATTIAVAADVAARIGYVSSVAPIEIRTETTLTDADLESSNIVVVGLLENQPLIQRLADSLPARAGENGYYAADGLLAPPEHGVVQFVRSPWNPARYVLLVSGGNSTGLELAGRAFVNTDVFKTLTGSFQFVESAAPSESATRNPWQAPEVTFAALGYGEAMTARGTASAGLTYYFRWPPGWTVGDGARLTLELASSPALETGSHIAVYVNDVLVGTQIIDAGNQQQRVVLDLPAQAINARLAGPRIRTMKLYLSAVNVLPADECRAGDTEIAWVRVQSDSSFIMPHQLRALADLQVFPYPFVSDDRQPVSIVVPDSPTEQDLGTALSIAAQLGSYSLADLNLTVVRASELSADAYANTNLIVLGTGDQQPWIQEFLTGLPAITTDGVYQALETRNTGVLIERSSPWNEDRWILLVSGDSPEGYARAAVGLYTLPPVEESGAAVVFEEDEAPRVLTVGAATP